MSEELMPKAPMKLVMRVRVDEPFAGFVNVECDLDAIASAISKIAIQNVSGVTNFVSSDFGKVSAALDFEGRQVRNVWMRLNGRCGSKVSTDSLRAGFSKNGGSKIEVTVLEATVVDKR